MEVTTKEYKIEDRELLFRANTRAMIEFERLSGKPLSLSSTMEDHVMFLYAGTVAGMKKAGREFTLDLEEYIDLIDDNLDCMDGLIDMVEDEEPSEKK
jgi:hypothetical protein